MIFVLRGRGGEYGISIHDFGDPDGKILLKLSIGMAADCRFIQLIFRIRIEAIEGLGGRGIRF